MVGAEAVARTARHQTVGEEIANAIGHGLGGAAAIAGLPVLIMAALRQDSTAMVVGSVTFGASAILLYFTSAMYHAMPRSRAKDILQKLDHAAIYLLIAGTYTPFTLGVLWGGWGWTLFGLIWALALTGIILKAADRIAHPISMALYLVMGWLILIAAYPLAVNMPLAGVLWLAGGGIAYSAGVIFFALDSRIRYGHAIWHLFVLTGTVCHYFAVLWYAGPVASGSA